MFLGLGEALMETQRSLFDTSEREYFWNEYFLEVENTQKFENQFLHTCFIKYIMASIFCNCI